MPIGFLEPDVLSSDLVFIVPKANLFHFGVLSSLMHMEWMRYTAGRLKSDHRYSNTLVYNNFPWPDAPTEKRRRAVEIAAQAVLDVRTRFPEATLADLYDPLTMPDALIEAHRALDKAVDACYGKRGFASERERVEFLFELYQRAAG